MSAIINQLVRDLRVARAATEKEIRHMQDWVGQMNNLETTLTGGAPPAASTAKRAPKRAPGGARNGGPRHDPPPGWVRAHVADAQEWLAARDEPTFVNADLARGLGNVPSRWANRLIMTLRDEGIVRVERTEMNGKREFNVYIKGETS